MPAAPFPICTHHALEVYQHMADVMPLVAGRLPDVTPDPSPSAPESTSLVYYVLIDGLVKIGTTENLPNRMRGYPPTAALLAVEPGDRTVEAARHRQFNHSLSAGREWFTPSADLRQHIESLPTYRAA